MTSLTTILRMNAASCIGFGALFVALPGVVAAFLGDPPAPDTVVRLLGGLLLLNGLHLLHTSGQAQPHRWLVLYFSLGDFLWVLATAGLIGAGLWITTPAGVAAAVAVAAAVGAMGIAQVAASRRNIAHRGMTTQ
jgi:hypothetical protein